jgi:integrase
LGGAGRAGRVGPERPHARPGRTGPAARSRGALEDVEKGLIRPSCPALAVSSVPAGPLPHARVHDLRHIHATTLLLAGVPVHVVAARLGHADPAITLRVYAHVIHEAEVAAAEVFAKVMAEAA